MSEFLSEFKKESNQSIGLSFIRVYNSWMKLIKNQLKDLDITHPQFVVMASLGYLSQNQDEVSQVEIAHQSDIDVMTVSTIIRNLEKSGIVSRKSSLRDSRAKVVTLTDLGIEILGKALPLIESVDRIFFGQLEDQEKLMNQLLHQLLGDS